MKTYDIVYPVGNGSTWNDDELRYSLRSLCKYYPNHGTVIIVGHKPKWLHGVYHIKAQDVPGIQNKEANIMRKLLLASDAFPEFIMFNDDHFLTKPLRKLPYYYSMSLQESSDKRPHDHYWHSLNNTIKVLGGGLNFDVHTPILYKSQKFKEAMSKYDWDIPFGYVIKSLYSNTVKVKGEQMDDLKINRRLNCFQLEKEIGDRPFFSIGDKAISPDLKIYMEYLYREKSPYE